MRKVVVLPQPDGPSIAMNSPCLELGVEVDHGAGAAGKGLGNVLQDDVVLAHGRDGLSPPPWRRH